MDHAKDQAQAQLEGIKELVAALDTQDDEALEAAHTAIYEDPLEVLVRSGWHIRNNEPSGPTELKILLCTGGSAVRIIAQLEDEMVSDSHLEYQDWFMPWAEFPLTSEDKQVIREYCCVLGF